MSLTVDGKKTPYTSIVPVYRYDNSTVPGTAEIRTTALIFLGFTLRPALVNGTRVGVLSVLHQRSNVYPRIRASATAPAHRI